MRPDLPSGTVTFLFTDVEGSTRLLHELGAEGYAQALAEHRRVIREACAAEGGAEVDTQGDAFFFAFPTAPGALAAAGALTQALASGSIQVRVGLHTGTPLLTDEGYVGGDVHRAARIAAAGHGGQVLVSASTAQLVEHELRDLGEHRFKDLAAPERVCQLGEGDFPPLKTLYRTNLPVPATPFLGRDRELGEVLELLTGDLRLLTLTGPGGTGKTRLALQAAAEAAEQYPEGVWWIPLAPLRDAELVLVTAGQVVGSKNGLAEHIADKSMLCLFDNFEQVVEAAAGLADLLAACPNLGVLVTSREPLRLSGEQEYSVPPLAHEEGVGFFLARARAVKPDFALDEAVPAICSRLDDLPLALELAAARVKVLSSAQILERLLERLPLLTGGARDAPERQRTLRATIEWSYDLLSDEEKALFARLGVFAGGCTLEAAEEVCGADLDTLQSLVDKSLARYSNERYWMLETIREYATERLEASGEAAELRRRHAVYLRELGRSLGLTMESIERVRVQRHDIAIAEQNNFRAAIDWAMEADLALAVEVAFWIENFWVTHDVHEGVRRFDAILEREDELPVALWAAAHRCRGNVRILSGDRARGVADYEAALAGYREAGDEIAALAVEHRALINREVGDLTERRRGLEGLLARFRTAGLATGEVQVLGSLAGIEARLGDTDRAAELLREASDRAASIGFVWIERSHRDALALLELERGRLEAAREQGLRALELATRAGDRLGTVYTLTFFARLAARGGENERAGALWGALEAEADRTPLGIWAAEAQGEVEASLPVDDPAFARGRERARRGSLDEAVALARGEAERDA